MNTFNTNSVSSAASGGGRAISRRQLRRVNIKIVFAPTFAPQVVLLGEIAQGWRLIKPLTVNFEPDGLGWIASDDEFAIFGTGGTRTQAACDYVIALIEYHQLLARYDDAPSVTLFGHLQSFLVGTE